MLTIDANIWVAAFDHRDRFHKRSVEFLRVAMDQGLALHGPAFLIVEVSCAVARRTGHPSNGAMAGDRLRRHPALTLHALDERLLSVAGEIGVRHLLRAADALYAATAQIAAAPLITWDDELVERAAAITPDSWLASRR